MIEIRPIQPHEWDAARRLVYRVAHSTFHETRPLEEMIRDHDARGALDDLLDIQANYFDNGGTFLVMTENGEMIGTGAIRKYEESVCELKRVWFLPNHHGKGLGYRMLQELFEIARAMGYKKMYLQTDPVAQKRAYDLYKRIGFTDLPLGDHDSEDSPMQMDL
jgi:putative acetyltransferase